MVHDICVHSTTVGEEKKLWSEAEESTSSAGFILRSQKCAPYWVSRNKVNAFILSSRIIAVPTPSSDPFTDASL